VPVTVVAPVTNGVKLAEQLAVPELAAGKRLQLSVGLKDPGLVARKVTLPVGVVAERRSVFETVAIQAEAWLTTTVGLQLILVLVVPMTSAGA
jgi:hypothetical protein